MADRRRAALMRGAVYLCTLAGGGTALAQETPATAGGNAVPGSATAGSASTGSAFPGSSGPLLAAPGVLQQTGFGPSGPDIRLGNLAGSLTRLAGGAPAQSGPARAWTVTSSLSVSGEYVTGGQGSGQGSGYGGLGNQFIGTIQPSIAASADTVRLHGEAFYAPQISVYSRDGRDDQVAQTVNGRLLATLVEQTLFLDLRGSGSEQAITPGQSPYGGTTLSRGNLSQTYSFSAAPYAVHRFGDWGTAELGAGYGRTLQSAVQGFSALPATTTVSAAAANQNLTSLGGHLAFVTGEAFARYNAAALAQANSFSGGGVLQGAYRNTVTLDNGYAVTRTVTALAMIGWEDIHYSGLSPITIDDATWSVGTRLTPNPDSSITLRYGHQDGVTSFFLNGGYQATARTHIFASYSEGLTTSAEQFQNALATSDLDALGNPVDHTTGAPLVPVGNFFGLSNSVFRTTLASVTIAWLLDRNSVSASVNSQTQTLVSASSQPGLQSGNSRGVYGTISWSRELRPALTGNAYAEYGTSSSSGSPSSGRQRLLTVSAGLSYAWSETLSGRLQYIFSQTTGQTNGVTALLASGASGSQSVFLVSLVKTFF